MKKWINLFLLLGLCIPTGIQLKAQAPEAFNYQAVIRDGTGAIMPNRTVSFRISLVEGGTPLYTERHVARTNEFGLVNLEIGNGTALTGSMSGVSWSSGQYFLRIEMDPNGGTNYYLMGTSQLLSVPFALRAKTVQFDQVDDADADPANEIQVLSLNGNNLFLSKGGGNVALPVTGDNWGTQVVQTDATLNGNGTTGDLLKIAANGINSSKIQDGSVAGNDLEDNSVGSAKIQSGAVTTDKLAANAVTSGKIGDQSVTGAKIAQAGATNGTNRMIIQADGQIDMARHLNINSTVPDGQALWVNGKEALWFNGTYFSWGFDGSYNLFADPVTIGNGADPSGYMLWVQGNAWSTGSWLSSDARYKKSIRPIDHALDRLQKISGSSFEFRQDGFKDYHFDEGIQYGLIAQDVEPVFPELVKTGKDGYRSVNYNGMIPVLIEAIKEQQAIIDHLRNENQQLKSAQDQVRTRLDKLERYLLAEARKN